MVEKKPEPKPLHETSQPKPSVQNLPTQPSPLLRSLALGFFCFTLSFLGAWAAIASGIVEGETTLSEKRSVVSQEEEVVADVAERVSPSVVSIVTQSEASIGFRSFTQQGAGSGVIITETGYVLTNRHVVTDVGSINIVLADGTTYEDVEIAGVDSVNDIAFLKINGAKGLKPATIGDSSEMEVGEKVIAIGNALGQYQTSVTSGIISGLGRPLVAGSGQTGDAERLTNLLQTDAAINPGNSGGPLVNLDGEVIGINTAIDQEAQGIGFAIPINDTKGLIKSVTTTGKLSRAFLGVSHVSVNAEVAKEYSLPVKYGAYVVNEAGDAVTAGSPAQRAGIREGDVITKVAGSRLGPTRPLLSVISGYVPGDEVSVTYLRDGKEKTVDVTLATYPQQ